ncbi:MAG: WecB/TagA/CpsF family glycosyltransferase [Bacteroidetes bacterium]|nr:WecB/TagA/CpsF family glycosyltransferase [Bacteroidota bacterium]
MLLCLVTGQRLVILPVNSIKVEKVRLVNLLISPGTFRKILDEILVLGFKRQSSYVCLANVHLCMALEQDQALREMVNHADIVAPDGMPLVLAMKDLYGKVLQRVSGPDLLPALLMYAENYNLSAFYLMSDEVLLSKLLEYTRSRHPWLIVSGVNSIPNPAIPQEVEDCIYNINASKANFLLVSMPSPAQEKWMAEMHGKINACMIGIGSAVKILLGLEKRAPYWMQQAGLEWLYMLSAKPLQRFKQYFVPNARFMALILKEKIKLSLNRKYRAEELAKRSFPI